MPRNNESRAAHRAILAFGRMAERMFNARVGFTTESLEGLLDAEDRRSRRGERSLLRALFLMGEGLMEPKFSDSPIVDIDRDPEKYAYCGRMICSTPSVSSCPMPLSLNRIDTVRSMHADKKGKGKKEPSSSETRYRQAARITSAMLKTKKSELATPYVFGWLIDHIELASRFLSLNPNVIYVFAGFPVQHSDMVTDLFPCLRYNGGNHDSEKGWDYYDVYADDPIPDKGVEFVIINNR